MIAVVTEQLLLQKRPWEFADQRFGGSGGTIHAQLTFWDETLTARVFAFLRSDILGLCSKDGDTLRYRLTYRYRRTQCSPPPVSINIVRTNHGGNRDVFIRHNGEIAEKLLLLDR